MTTKTPRIAAMLALALSGSALAQETSDDGEQPSLAIDRRVVNPAQDHRVERLMVNPFGTPPDQQAAAPAPTLPGTTEADPAASDPAQCAFCLTPLTPPSAETAQP